MPVILFDIDGTLIRTGGAGKVAMESALTETFLVTLSDERVPYSGRTDFGIGRELLHVHGIEPSHENLTRLHDAYLGRLPACLEAHPGSICAGVAELLAAIHPNEEILLGLLTGNIRRGAELKLSHFKLWRHFVCGGFGDLHFDRDEVAHAALRAVNERMRTRVEPSDIWVIGDTPLDVKCARAIGAKAVAVATGWHDLEELAESKPDFLFADLTAAQPLLDAWR